MTDDHPASKNTSGHGQFQFDARPDEASLTPTLNSNEYRPGDAPRRQGLIAVVEEREIVVFDLELQTNAEAFAHAQHDLL